MGLLQRPRKPPNYIKLSVTASSKRKPTMRSNGATMPVAQLASRPGQAGQMPLQLRKTARIRRRGAAPRPRFYVTRAMSASAPGGTVGEQASLPHWLGRRRTPLQPWNDGEQRQKRVKPTVGGAERCCSCGTRSQDERMHQGCQNRSTKYSRPSSTYASMWTRPARDTAPRTRGRPGPRCREGPLMVGCSKSLVFRYLLTVIRILSLLSL
jgi:hypothetical protein